MIDAIKATLEKKCFQQLSPFLLPIEKATFERITIYLFFPIDPLTTNQTAHQTEKCIHFRLGLDLSKKCFATGNGNLGIQGKKFQ